MPPAGDRTFACNDPCDCCSGEGRNAFNRLDDRSCPQCRPRSDLTSSSSFLSFHAVPLKDYDKLWRIVAASAKGFAIGAGIKGGLSLFSLLARLRRRQLLSSAKKARIASSQDNVVLAVKEILRYGLFLGTFAGTFVSVDEIIANLGGHCRTARWRALLAGAIAGPSMLLTGLNTHHWSLAVYILMRAAVLASRCGVKSRRFKNVLKPLTWEHGDILLMCLASSQFLSAYILNQESLPPSYKSFLNKHGGKDPIIRQGVKDLTCGVPFTNLEAIEQYYKTRGVNIKLDPHMKIPCTIIHGNQSCTSHFVSFLIQAYQRALPVYLPAYLIPALIFQCKSFLKRPYATLRKCFLGIARSSFFLSVYSSFAWMWPCLFFQHFQKCNIPILATGTFPTGLALAIEKKSRRMEISLYSFGQALESFFKCMIDAGYLQWSKKLRRADVMIFSISTAIIMHCYAVERDVFRSGYLSFLDWVFGVPLPPRESPEKDDPTKI